MNRRFKIILIFTFLMFTTNVIWGSDSPLDRETLRGLDGFLVLVETIDPEIERDGLTTSKIQSDVELKLRLAGIKILTSNERMETEAGAYLYINVNIVKLNQGSYVNNISIAANQNVFLKHNFSPCIAETWSVSMIGLNSNLDVIRSSIKDVMDIFLNAWLSVNPKE